MNATLRKAPSLTTKKIYLQYREILKLHHKRLQFYFLRVANSYIRKEFDRHIKVGNDDEITQFLLNCDTYKSKFIQEFTPEDKLNSMKLTTGSDIKYYDFMTINKLNSMNTDKPIDEQDKLYHERLMRKYEEEYNLK